MQLKKFLTFDDVALVPSFSNLTSRLEPDTSTWLTKDLKIPFPIVNSPMDSVIGYELADLLIELGSVPIFNRLKSFEQYENLYNKYENKVFACTGVQDLDYTKKVLDLGFDKILLDTANGWTRTMLNFIYSIKKYNSKVQVMAGNISTAMGYVDLVNAGADSVRVGIGNGCFAEDTQVLMADGNYRGISKIKAGEYVINRNGKPVKVLKVLNKGFREVRKIRTSNWYKPTYVTPDHNYYIGDLTQLSYNTIQSKGIAALLRRDRKNRSNFTWSPIGDADPKKNFLLTPSDIKFTLRKQFKVDLQEYSTKSKVEDNQLTTNGYNKFNRFLYSNYNLGYIFGLFLGDGCSNLCINKKNCESGKVIWYFNITELSIINKLLETLRKELNISGKVTLSKNCYRVTVYNKCLARLFAKFGKNQNKKLPLEFYCSDVKYLEGLYDGLVDSDGHEEQNGRVGFFNTSLDLLNLFNFLCFSLNKTFSNATRKGIQGNLTGKIGNYSDLYSCRVHTSNRLCQQFWYSTILEIETVLNKVEVWDIEVDCPTHSFIANNSIVHNSACTTRIVTAVGLPAFSVLCECAEMSKKYKIPFLCDGGIRNSRDLSLAVAAGATACMVGKLLALTNESAAEKKEVDEQGILFNEGYGKKTLARYRGQASEEYQVANYGKVKEGTVPEGIGFWAPVTGSAKDVLKDLVAGLRSSMTYLGAKNIKEYQQKSEFVEVTPSYMIESKPRPE